MTPEERTDEQQQAELRAAIRKDFNDLAEKNASEAENIRKHGVFITRRNGKGAINEVFYFGEERAKCKLLFVRIHFSANGQTEPYEAATARVEVATEAAEEHNCQLYRIPNCGPHTSNDNDLFLRNEREDTENPSTWTVPEGSGFRIRWSPSNTNYKWGIEVGLATAT